MFWWLVFTCAWLARACAATAPACAATAPVVLTSGGPVRGRLLTDHGVAYYAYQGIPYAENPTGNLRFKPPVPKQPWHEVLDASRPGPVCPQAEGAIKRAGMSEDCLHVNVYVPANRTRESMPVLAFVHGGLFKFNSGNIDIKYGPQLFLKRDLIYVSMNYRLGALGYLSMETEDASGNAGLKDLLLALKWIKQNIPKFGGDSITIVGQSSGASMVHYMMLTNKSHGLFDRAILTSGSATNFRFLSRYPRKHTYALAKELGLLDESDDIVLQNLRKSDVFDIIDAQENLYKNTRNIMNLFAPFVPCIEKESESSILTQDPTEIIEEGIPQNVPTLAGINSLEGAYLWPTLHNKPTETLQEKFPLAIPADIEYPKNSKIYKDLVNSISTLYFGDVDLSNWTSHNFYSLLSDTQYTYSVGSWIKTHKDKKNSEKLYYYLFNFDGELKWAKTDFNISIPGVAHADEIGYLFVNRATEKNLENIDIKSEQTLNNMLTLFSNFIKFGNPTPTGCAGSLMWPDHGDGGYLILNETPTLAPNVPFEKRFAFWTSVYQKYRQYLRIGGEVQTKAPPHKFSFSYKEL